MDDIKAGISTSSVEKKYFSGERAGLLAVVGDASAAKHVDPSVYEKWQTIILTKYGGISMRQEWMEVMGSSY